VSELAGAYRELYSRLVSFIPEERLLTDPLLTLAYGTDASFYRLVPKIVVKVENENDVVRLLRESHELHLPVTFRAAGTSLSGQAISDSILAVLGPSWKRYSIAADAATITLQPGIVGGRANAWLAPLGKKIGPDPASINSAMIGGIVANNASGMCCGTAQNSYRTIAGMRIILADGTVLDTRDRGSRESFLGGNRAFVDRLMALHRDIAANHPLAERIRRKFKMKNTTGYSLNAFVDFENPIDIIEHLMVGSEGTLGFIAEVTYFTVPELPHKASALLLFPTIVDACRAVEILKLCPVEAVELMDRASLRSVEEKEGMPEYLRGLDDDVASLLVETRATDSERLAEQMNRIISALGVVPMVMPPAFTTVPEDFAKLWNIRKGLFPSVGAMRRTGTTCIIEDVAFPVPRLAEATADLQSLFKKHGYADAIIFGHALEGNLHFVFSQDFNVPAEVARYASFISDVSRLVVEKFDGSLKAEHGTGRNMAPFVELEWGAEAHAIMKEIKRLFDPENLLNPGVILNDDPQAHLASLKPLPEADPLIDKCIECGFCEVQCPSRNLTLTPRHRIAVYREIARLKREKNDPARLASLLDGFDYAADETCATDGLCSLACPVGINTGDLIKELRLHSHSALAQRFADAIAGHMGAVTGGMRMGLNVVGMLHGLLGTRLMTGVSASARWLTGGAFPSWNPYMPRGADRARIADSGEPDQATVVYFPSCINRTMGTSRDYSEPDSLTTRTESVLRKAGYRIVYPDHLSSLCCGMAFDSKGFKRQGERKSRELEAELLKASDNGKYPIYVDMSPCLYRMKQTLDQRLQVYEPVRFITEFLLDRLEFHKTAGTVAIHTTCSSTKMGLGAHLQKVAALCAGSVIVPEDVGCCGWAGDRGFTFPELNRSALASLRNSLPADCHEGYSTSRTCEIGLSLHSGVSYKSIVYLVDRCTTPKKTIPRGTVNEDQSGLRA
jgi:D-lactate dehydrogenase